jgi:hypothetical protein
MPWERSKAAWERARRAKPRPTAAAAGQDPFKPSQDIAMSLDEALDNYVRENMMGDPP